MQLSEIDPYRQPVDIFGIVYILDLHLIDILYFIFAFYKFALFSTFSATALQQFTNKILFYLLLSFNLREQSDILVNTLIPRVGWE